MQNTKISLKKTFKHALSWDICKNSGALYSACMIITVKYVDATEVKIAIGYCLFSLQPKEKKCLSLLRSKQKNDIDKLHSVSFNFFFCLNIVHVDVKNEMKHIIDTSKEDNRLVVNWEMNRQSTAKIEECH